MSMQPEFSWPFNGNQQIERQKVKGKLNASKAFRLRMIKPLVAAPNSHNSLDDPRKAVRESKISKPTKNSRAKQQKKNTSEVPETHSLCSSSSSEKKLEDPLLDHPDSTSQEALIEGSGEVREDLSNNPNPVDLTAAFEVPKSSVPDDNISIRPGPPTRPVSAAADKDDLTGNIQDILLGLQERGDIKVAPPSNAYLNQMKSKELSIIARNLLKKKPILSRTEELERRQLLRPKIPLFFKNEESRKVLGWGPSFETKIESKNVKATPARVVTVTLNKQKPAKKFVHHPNNDPMAINYLCSKGNHRQISFFAATEV